MSLTKQVGLIKAQNDPASDYKKLKYLARLGRNRYSFGITFKSRLGATT